jgi:hypothetical protein
VLKRHIGQWLRISSIGWDWAAVIGGSASRALFDQSFIPGLMLLAGVILTLMTAYRERKAMDVPALCNSLVVSLLGSSSLRRTTPYIDGAKLRRIILAVAATGALVLLWR